MGKGRKTTEYRLFFKGKFLAEGTLKELAEKTNLALSTITAYKAKIRPKSVLYEFVEIPDETEFSIYSGDCFLDIGTKKELMEKYEITSKDWSFYASPTAIKRAESRKFVTNGIVIERIEDDDTN